MALPFFAEKLVYLTMVNRTGALDASLNDIRNYEGGR